MKDVMVDIETLSTRHDAWIIAIGACAFDLNTGEIASDRLRLVIAGASIPKDRHVSPDTVAWWAEQDDDLVRDLFEPADGGVDYGEALDRLAQYLRRKRVWAKPPQFDLVILRNAYRAADRPCPWHYRDERCARTLMHLGKSMQLPRPDPPTVKHDPLADAIAQAQAVCTVWQAVVGG